MTYEKINWVDLRIDRPNTYICVDNADGTKTITPAWNKIEGTPVNAENLNHMDDGIADAHLRIDKSDRRITRLEAYLDIDSRGVSGAQARFADTYDGQPDPVLQMDSTKTYALAAVSASSSTVSIPVASTTGFSIGQEVTICDDEGFENRLIKDIGVGTISFAALANDYKKGALIARSTVEVDTVNQKMKIGNWGTYTIAVSEL
ncbi:integrase [Brevibacillus thermoruber]|uniref:integrase n=1 Tax=Brevibacillus thermoruber TaxID=33942 RepID=UPI004041D7E4